MIKTKPYKDIVLEFDETRHIFYVNGEKLNTSVTGITGIIDKSGALVGWAVKLFREFLLEKISSNKNITEDDVLSGSKQHIIAKQKAGDIGTEIHKWAELYIKKKNPPMPEDEKVKNGALAFLKWIDENKVKFINSEECIYSKKYKYAGILDLEAKVNGELCIVDFKSSNGVYDDMRFQVAGYQLAKEEMTGKKYDTRWLIQFGKETGDFKAHRLDDYKKDRDAFLACLTIKRRLAELKK